MAAFGSVSPLFPLGPADSEASQRLRQRLIAPSDQISDLEPVRGWRNEVPPDKIPRALGNSVAEPDCTVSLVRCCLY